MDAVDPVKGRGSLLHAAAAADQAECVKVGVQLTPLPHLALHCLGRLWPTCKCTRKLVGAAAKPALGALRGHCSCAGASVIPGAASGHFASIPHRPACTTLNLPCCPYPGVQLLLKSGADVDLSVEGLGTALHAAAAAGAGNAVTLLLAK